MKPSIYIGIDPDCEKSGVATDTGERIDIFNMSFFMLYKLLEGLKINGDVLFVRIEAGWLKTAKNFHKGYRNKEGKWVKNSEFVNERISNKTGANHETGRKIAEMCEYLGIKYELVLPMGKVDSKTFEAITGIKKSNQDQRDAAMLIWNYRNLK